MVEELMTQLQPIIISACVTIITTVATYVGVKVKQILQEKVNTEAKKNIVETTCKYINQVYKELDGPAKLQKAQEAILEQLNEKGLKITELEMRVMIEAAVNGFKDGVNKPAEIESK